MRVRTTVCAGALIGALGGLPAHAEPESTRVPEELVAISAELTRGIEKLRLPDAPAPYRAEARLVRAQTLSLDGSYGGLITNVLDHQSTGTVSLRVGSIERDNSNFLGGDSGVARIDVSLEPAPAFLRKKVWLGLDRAYRGATQSMASKLSALERLSIDTPPPDFTEPPAPVVRLAPGWADGLDRERLGVLVAELSERFERYPEIDNGDVHLQVLRSHETVVSSDGLVGQWSHERTILAVTADTLAPDGMPLDHGAVLHFQRVPEPNDALRRDGEALVDQVLTELQAMAAAPLIDEEYDGPILFLPRAGAQLLASTAATQVSGMPAPLGDSGRMTELEPAWQRRLGKNVLPPFLDLIDDPSDGFGSFDLDAQGVVPGRVTLVRGGELVGLLMTRTPNPYATGSNGRARMSPSLSSGPTISNLSLQSRRRGLSGPALERELLMRAREDGYDFAYIIESLRDGSVLGPVPRDSAAAFAGTGKIDLPLPAKIVRLESGGRKTLVRGAILAPASMRVLRRIRAVGQDLQRIPMRIPVGSFGGFNADVGIDGILSQTVDVEVRCPELLIEGLELLVERGEFDKPPTLSHPLRRPAGDGEKAGEAGSPTDGS